MSWRSASAWTVEPRLPRRLAGDRADRDHPGAFGEAPAERLGQVSDRRGGGEGDVVGFPGRLDRLRRRLLADGLVDGDVVDLGAAVAEAVREDVAGLGRAGEEDATAVDLDLGEGIEQGLGDEPLGDDVGLDPVRRSAPLAVPGPIAATVAPASARASRPAARSASNRRRTPFGLVRQTTE